jgi:chromosome segregation ATPase
MDCVEPCSKNEEFKRLHERIDGVEEKVSRLNEGQAETRVYVKQIFDRLDDMKIMFQSAVQVSKDTIKENNSTWKPIIIELIKLVTVIAGIVAGVKLLN